MAHAADHVDTILEVFPSPAGRLNGAGEIRYLNAAWRSYATVSGESNARRWTQLVHPEDRHTALSNICAAVAKREASSFECRLQSGTGAVRWFQLNLQPVEQAPVGEGSCLLFATDIHELKCREVNLQKLSAIQTDMLNVSVDCIKLIALDGSVIHLNRAGCIALGVPANSPFGMPWLPLLPEDVWEAGEAALAVARSGTFARFPGRSVLPSQKPQYWDNMLTPVMSAGGQPMAILCVSREVTGEREAQAALRESQERLALAVQVGGLGIWDYTIDSDELYCDPQWYRILGLDPATRLKSIADFRPYIHPDDVARATDVPMADLTAMLARKEDYSIVFRIVRPAGEMRWIRSAACLIAGDAGVPNRAVGVIADVTEAHLAEQALQDSYDALRRAEKIAKIGSWTLDLTTSQFSASDMLYEMNGIEPKGAPLTIPDLERMLSHETCQKVAGAIERCAKTGEAYGIDGIHLRPDGTEFAVHIRGEAQYDAEGRLIAISGTVQDVSEREEARARLEAVADNLPNGALYRLEQRSDCEFTLSYLSAGVERLIGIPAEKMVADLQIFVSMIDPDDLLAYQAAVDTARRSGTPFDQEFRVRTREGRCVWLHCRSVPRVATDGIMVWDGIMRDVSSEKEFAETLRRAKEKAEQAERAKGDFLATMSHEIRTPMNTVVGMTRLALQTDLLPKQRNYLEKVDRSAKTLLGIINDVLDYSKIEAGGLQLEDTPFVLDSVLESVSAVTATLAEEKGLEIVYRINSNVPRVHRGDPLRLGQVMTNLISNAVKFTAAGEVVVSVNVIPAQASRSLLHFEVRDTGIGLSAVQIAGLFRPFAQAGIDTARKYGGTGLGLTICHRLVGMMGGRIEVESKPGEGSKFSFIIPAATTQLATYVGPSQQLESRRALIVDDNASAREILVEMLRGFGMDAMAVATGKECLPTLLAAMDAGRPFEIVLMDWRMPELDGLETARLVRTNTRLKQMPALLMVTAYGREEVVRGVETLGLQGLLIKPITESTMFNTLSEILGCEEPKIAPTGLTSERALRFGPSRREAFFSALAGKHVLVVDDNSLNREVASDFLLAAGVFVDTAVDGLDALDHLERQDYDAVLMDIHMPQMGGLEAIKTIRAQSRWSGLPVIALTAQARDDDRRASLDAGMTAHLSKPIDEIVLYKLLAAVISQSEVMDENAIQKGGEVSEAISFELDVASALQRLTRGEPDRARRLLGGFLRDFADAGRRARHYLQENNTKALEHLAHTLKGSASYLDAATFCKVADELENAARAGDASAIASQIVPFCHLLDELLAAVRAAIHSPDSDIDAAESGADVRKMIEIALPLVTKGDHAAQVLLERICATFEHGPTRTLAERALADFGDLELTQAEAALRELQCTLAQQMGRAQAYP